MALRHFLTRTLSARLFLLSSIWAIISIAAVAFFISSGYRDNSERRLQELLTANLYALMANVEPSETGKLIGSPDLRDARFLKFQSGFYWSVTEIKKPTNRLASASLADEKISQKLNVDFDENFEKTFTTTDKVGNRLLGVEAQVFLGEGDDVFSFQITGNKESLNSDVREFTKQILLLLFLFALGFILVSFFLVRFGLAPLREVSNRLSDIREGKADSLKGNFPAEIQPLVDEANSLIHSNNIVVERARTQVGNLAHSLKTPLAVLKNEAGNAKPKIRHLIEGQIEQMQSQIQAYLDRARIAARVGSVTSRTQVVPVVDRLVRVMNKLNPHLIFSVVENANTDKLVFAGEQQDLEEMLGNLLENAGKFANQKVSILLLEEDNQLVICVEDDGSGLSESESEIALSRGGRIDETKPGSGLGLSIVKDIANEYGGTIKLGKSIIKFPNDLGDSSDPSDPSDPSDASGVSGLGGLCAKLTLPKV